MSSSRRGFLRDLAGSVRDVTAAANEAAPDARKVSDTFLAFGQNANLEVLSFLSDTVS